MSGAAIGVFCVGASEYLIAGLAPSIATGLRTTVAQASGLITVYAAVVAVAGPLLTLAVSRVERRSLLIGLLAAFGAANLLAAVSTGMTEMMVSRIVAAATHCPIVAMALVIASRHDDATRQGRAMARISVALNLATAVGVPLALAINTLTSWRMAFVLLALAAGVAVAHVVRCPRDEPATTARAEIRALLRPRVLVAIATTFLATIGGYATYTFIAPILTDETGFAHDHLWLLLLLFGLGSLAGSVLGGRLADYHLDRGLRIGLAVLAATTLLFGLSLHSKVFTAILLFVLGAAFFLIVPALNARIVVGTADLAPTLATSVNVAAYNLSIMVASGVARLAVEGGTGLQGLVLLSALSPIAAVALTAVGTNVVAARGGVARSFSPE
ncbi:MFS transporter [Lentzea flava]|uniref:MFS transporter n=1 Tax=Lentzea flava TaxID=103732 RepID=A0ABQ2UDS0_9PSEU|nr:MFS transporter [Lentzea flava]